MTDLTNVSNRIEDLEKEQVAIKKFILQINSQLDSLDREISKSKILQEQLNQLREIIEKPDLTDKSAQTEEDPTPKIDEGEAIAKFFDRVDRQMQHLSHPDLNFDVTLNSTTVAIQSTNFFVDRADFQLERMMFLLTDFSVLDEELKKSDPQLLFNKAELAL